MPFLIRHRPERDERKRAWFSPNDCLSNIRQWHSDPSSRDEPESGNNESESTAGVPLTKKDKKGGAMEEALKAFADKYGWEKGEGGAV